MTPSSISVVIPAYNASRYIAETLESVLNQTLAPAEVLVIDDGSTDETAAVAEQFAPRVKVFRRANARQGASRNFGVQQARGEWVAFIDSDDIWEPKKLERQMEEVARTPGVGLCYTALVPFRVVEGEVVLDAPSRVPPAAKIREALYHSTTFLPSTVLVRRSTFLEAGGFATHFRVAEDWDLWLRMLHSGVVFAGCQEPLLRYRVHPDGVSNNALVSLREAKEVLRRQIAPMLPAPTRWMTVARTESAHESAAAQTLRHNKDPRCKLMMLRSLVRFPFNDPRRYKMFAHMVLKGPK